MGNCVANIATYYYLNLDAGHMCSQKFFQLCYMSDQFIINLGELCSCNQK